MSAKKEAEAAKGDVEEQIDEENAKGFHGDKVDPKANEEYTVEGSVKAAEQAAAEAEKEK